VCVAADILSLTVLTPPGKMGADIVVGSAQRFGVPMGFGGPHAAFFATRDEYKRSMPGRLIGVSRDANGKPALRLSLQTREQHIRREKATSNICTAQVLLANMASMYAVYHGPKGLRAIAERVNKLTGAFAALCIKGGLTVTNTTYFDTVVVDVGAKKAKTIAEKAEKSGVLVRVFSDSTIGVSFDEAKGIDDLQALCAGIGLSTTRQECADALSSAAVSIPKELVRGDDYLHHAVFNTYHSETEFLRYMRKVESRDLSLGFSMIPLGSCPLRGHSSADFTRSLPRVIVLGTRRCSQTLRRVCVRSPGSTVVRSNQTRGLKVSTRGSLLSAPITTAETIITERSASSLSQRTELIRQALS
jgi:glycine dehydrogenase